ncbi:MAG: sulfatase-like hydrolase/transferase, partial [Solirubrobacterales bacterium]
RSRTVVIRCSDHGEMGLSHGGLRQKMFNAYEETIHVPLIVSNPVLFPRAARTGALASLIDLLPTVATLSGATLDPAQPDAARGRDLSPVLAAHATPERDRLGRSRADFSPVTEHGAPQPSVQDAIHFTYDDHQAATALQNVPGQPNRIRAVRTERHKHALYFDPAGHAATEYELYDLERDPDEATNLVDRYGDPASTRSASDRRLRAELAERLDALIARNGTGHPD